MPNALDLGAAAPGDLRDVLPQGVIERAAQLGHWAVENAKSARAFLKRVDAIVPLAQPLQSIAISELPRPPKGGGAMTRPPAWDSLLAPVRAGHDLGLLSESGLPAVADPGAGLVRAAHSAGVPVVALPGPSALLLALAASGLDGQSFAFVGYVPVKAAARAARIRELEATSQRLRQTQLMIETPYRNASLLDALLTNAGPSTRLSVSCGLTLEGGWTRSATVLEWKAARVAMPGDVPAVFALLAAD